MIHQIEVGPSKSIRVASQVFDKPDLFPRPELDDSVKSAICGAAPWDEGVKAVHKFYCERLGPKFNRRFQAANYWLWIGNVFNERTANLLRRNRRQWRFYDETLVERANSALPYIREAENDGLVNLIPLIVTFALSPQEIRKHVGAAAWRRAANFSISRNKLIMHAMKLNFHTVSVEPQRFERLIKMRSGILPYVVVVDDDEAIAARICTRPDVFRFHGAVHLVRDTRRMVGEAFNASWSLKRMQREHDAAARNLMLKQYSDEPFTDEWSFANETHVATLLRSPVDIAHEGHIQRHCVGSYASRAKRGDYAVFRIEGRDRATLGVNLSPRISLDQIYGAFNERVSDECFRFAHLVVKAYAGEERRVAA